MEDDVERKMLEEIQLDVKAYIIATLELQSASTWLG